MVKSLTHRLCLLVSILGLCWLSFIMSGCSSSHSHYLEPDQVSFTPQLIWDRDNYRIKNADDRKPLSINIYWKPDPALFLDERSLFYPPYIAIIFPEELERAYMGQKLKAPALYKGVSFPPHIIELLQDDPNYNWDYTATSSDLNVFTLKAKSFGQGFVTMNIEIIGEPETEGSLFFYFIYYDPVTQKGWYKTSSVKLPLR